MTDAPAHVEPSIEAIRSLWIATETGRHSDAVSSSNEIEYYWTSMIFSIQSRLETIQRAVNSIGENNIKLAISREKDQIHKELQLCSEIFRLLLLRK